MKIFKLVTYYLGFMLLVFRLLSFYTGVNFILRIEVVFIEWEILRVNRARVIITLLIDWMSITFMGLVLFISSIVIFYRTYYMRGDKFFYRFILLVYLFVLSIVFLILSPNMIRILLGWDGLGLVSYCLVIYYQNNKSANAGIITILSNRVGDVAILLRISWMLNFGGWNFFYLQHLFTKSDLLFITVMVIIAGITKSAQIPFSAWLPAAIAAPTPVSSLVHSSTLVTAGVYLLIRFNYIIGINEVLFYIGVFTMFISGLGANFEIDLKKIIALSTLSQLGLIIITLSIGFYELSFFHLITHAIFKSLLFLCAGVFIHSMGDIQDIRLIGGLYISCPVTRFYFIGSSLALCGFPFLSGFYSKDLILEVYFMLNINLIIYLVIFISTMFTLTYSVRLVYYIFFNAMGYKTFLYMEEESGIFIPMRFLFMLSIYAGGVISSFIFPLVCVSLPPLIKMSVLIRLLILSILVYLNINLKIPGVVSYRKVVVNYLGSMWFLPALSSIIFMPVIKLGQLFLKLMDQGWLEFIGGQGAMNKFKRGSIYLDTFNLINIKSYLLMFFFLRIFLFLLVI